MNDLTILLKGMAAGLAISAPVGPVNVLCASRAVAKGRKAGVISGLGAAAADTLYGAIAGFSIQFIIGFLIREEFWIRLFGGMALIGMGVLYYFHSPRKVKDIEKGKSSHSEFVTAFLLNLTNPTIVLSFLAVLTALGLHGQKSPAQALILVGGIFMGAMIWWIGLAMVASRFSGRMTDEGMVWMNRVGGMAIGVFGLVCIGLAALAR